MRASDCAVVFAQANTPCDRRPSACPGCGAELRGRLRSHANAWRGKRIRTNAGEIPGNEIHDDPNGYIEDILGWDISEGDRSDENGRRTHVVGTSSATADNSTVVIGVVPGVTIVPLRFLCPTALGDLIGALDAIASSRAAFVAARCRQPRRRHDTFPAVAGPSAGRLPLFLRVPKGRDRTGCPGATTSTTSCPSRSRPGSAFWNRLRLYGAAGAAGSGADHGQLHFLIQFHPRACPCRGTPKLSIFRGLYAWRCSGTGYNHGRMGTLKFSQTGYH